MESTFDAEAFDGVIGFADTCRINKSESNAADIDRIFYHIARSAMNVAHNSLFLVKQHIKERGFSGIRFADDRYRNTVLNGIAHIERVCQPGNDFLYVVRQLA